MSAFRDALESGLRCPKCKEVNIPGRSPKVQIVVGKFEQGACDNCGHTGPLVTFLPQEHAK